MTTVLAAGDRIYKYQLQNKVGGGYFGDVWLALDLAVNRELAVKILDESMAPAAEALNEARLGNRLDHENVVKIDYADVVDHAGERLVLIAMDYHTRGSCTSTLNASKFLAAPRAVSIMIDVLRGLEYLHEKGLLHNDIKPSNILLADDGRALLADYGISCASPGGAPVLASGAYIVHSAPETQIKGTVSIATDIFQAGLTLFRLTSGVHLLDDLRSGIGDAEFQDLKNRGLISTRAGFAPFVDSRLRRIILKATSADPAERYESALVMRRALERVQHEGYWDVDQNGELVGVAPKSKFTFAVEADGSNLRMTAYRQNIASGRKTRVSAHSHRGISKVALATAQKNFMKAVIRGEV